MNEEEKKTHDQKKQKYKNKLAFKNIPEAMIEIMENPPNLAH